MLYRVIVSSVGQIINQLGALPAEASPRKNGQPGKNLRTEGHGASKVSRYRAPARPVDKQVPFARWSD